MKQCCIEGCGVLSKRNVTYFEFPTSRLLRKRWLDAIRPPVAGKLPSDALLCSRHFAAHHYEDVRGKIRLKGKVVPTIFGDEAQVPEILKDPLGLPDTTDNEELQESTVADKELTSSDNHNGKIDNDNGNIDKDNGVVDNAIANVDNDNGNVDNGNVNVDNDNGNDDNDNGNVANDNNKSNDAKSPSRDATENGHNDIVANDNDNRNNDNENEKTDSDNTNVDKDNESIGNNNEIVAKTIRNKLKKKWVPMRKAPTMNGHVVMSEDSSSQDSVNSDVPPPPILEDLEEHLPNYHIANLKTERQVAAMTETIDPIEAVPIEQEIEEIVMEPHIPVFIELSVGQDSNMPDSEEQPNDCLMVLESVQCDIDPTLMLEARAEDEECCEQIDLDDDDDDDDVVMNTDVIPSPAKIPKTPVDPISLLTSSDEDDVILQEPHIDTLSVSDETDEDDLPLQKLIKREKKKKKLKKTKKNKPEPVKSILVGATDFYCTYCQHVSPCRSTHDKHLKTHSKTEESQATTRVYQICKECGFTTSSKSQLHRHQRKHLNEKRFKCPLCTYRSKYNMSLMYHLKTHDFDPKMYNCGACGLELDSKKALLEHQSACCEISEKFLCGVCGLATKTKRAMKIHRKTVHKQKG